MLSTFIIYTFRLISRSFSHTYNVPRSEYSINNSTAEGGHHSKADEDYWSHQLEGNRGVSSSPVFIMM